MLCPLSLSFSLCLSLSRRQVVGIDCVDDESKPEKRLPRYPPPHEWTSVFNPPYSYYTYYLFAFLSLSFSHSFDRGTDSAQVREPLPAEQAAGGPRLQYLNSLLSLSLSLLLYLSSSTFQTRSHCAHTVARLATRTTSPAASSARTASLTASTSARLPPFSTCIVCLYCSLPRSCLPFSLSLSSMCVSPLAVPVVPLPPSLSLLKP